MAEEQAPASEEEFHKPTTLDGMHAPRGATPPATSQLSRSDSYSLSQVCVYDGTRVVVQDATGRTRPVETLDDLCTSGGSMVSMYASTSVSQGAMPQKTLSGFYPRSEGSMMESVEPQDARDLSNSVESLSEFSERPDTCSSSSSSSSDVLSSTSSSTFSCTSSKGTDLADSSSQSNKPKLSLSMFVSPSSENKGVPLVVHGNEVPASPLFLSESVGTPGVSQRTTERESTSPFNGANGEDISLSDMVSVMKTPMPSTPADRRTNKLPFPVLNISVASSDEDSDLPREEQYNDLLSQILGEMEELKKALKFEREQRMAEAQEAANQRAELEARVAALEETKIHESEEREAEMKVLSSAVENTKKMAQKVDEMKAQLAAEQTARQRAQEEIEELHKRVDQLETQVKNVVEENISKENLDMLRSSGMLVVCEGGKTIRESLQEPQVPAAKYSKEDVMTKFPHGGNPYVLLTEDAFSEFLGMKKSEFRTLNNVQRYHALAKFWAKVNRS